MKVANVSLYRNSSNCIQPVGGFITSEQSFTRGLTGLEATASSITFPRLLNEEPCFADYKLKSASAVRIMIKYLVCAML